MIEIDFNTIKTIGFYVKMTRLNYVKYGERRGWAADTDPELSPYKIRFLISLITVNGTEMSWPPLGLAEVQLESFLHGSC